MKEVPQISSVILSKVNTARVISPTILTVLHSFSVPSFYVRKENYNYDKGRKEKSLYYDLVRIFEKENSPEQV